jgi:spermidine synthase
MNDSGRGISTLARPWRTLERAETADGPLELRQRGEDDFLITIGGRVLMNSHANRSELALATLACGEMAGQAEPRVLVGGLGMGCTLRATLDALPAEAQVRVCELNPVMVEWCRGPLAVVNRSALDDPRVQIEIGDVSARIAHLADDRSGPRVDAILLDLYEGPHAGTHPKRDPLYGSRALDAARRALSHGGIFAVWSEDPDAAFERRLAAAGFEARRERPGQGGRRHTVYLAHRT